jgi:hypothetical protein
MTGIRKEKKRERLKVTAVKFIILTVKQYIIDRGKGKVLRMRTDKKRGEKPMENEEKWKWYGMKL